jgi:hypothetical protein
MGTATPATELEIYGDAPSIRISGNGLSNGNNYGSLEFFNYDASGDGPNVAAAIRVLAQQANGSGGFLTFATSLGNAGEGVPAVERVRIDASGNVGIGTSSPQASGGYGVLQLNGSTGGVVKFSDDDTLVSQIYGSDVSLNVQAEGARSVVIRTNGSERMSITSGGQFLVNTSSSIRTNAAMQIVSIAGAAATQPTLLLKHNSSDSITYGRSVEFFNLSDAEVGSIESNGTTTRYNTSSDYRLKENVVPMEGALDRVDALKPSRFNFIATPQETVDGFLAHEVAEVIPEAISGEKDAVDEEGKPKYQGIDHSKLVPVLTAAIQELSAKIKELESKLNG